MIRSFGLNAIALLCFFILDSNVEGGAPAVEAAAYPGKPLGMARVHFEIPDPVDTPPASACFNLAGEHRRVLYPVFLPDPVPSGPGGPAGAPGGFEVLFLYPGDEPVTLIATTNLSRSPYREFRATVSPGFDPTSRRDLEKRPMRDWWSAYRQILQDAKRRDAYYPVIESYLSWHLPRFLGLGEPPADVEPRTLRPLGAFPEADRLVDLFLGTESIRIALQREALLDTSSAADGRPSIPLPPSPAIPPVELPPAEKAVIEPIARCVPEECLYIRFPRFADFRSLREKVEELGGGVNDLILARSLDAGVKEALESQLALRETVLSRLFGDLVIGEMAIAAHDTFVREGSALGVIFEVRDERLFTASLRNLRDEAIEASKARPEGPAKEEKLVIGGRPVEFLSAPGNRIRSFHASAGRFHLVSNCRRLVERFLTCALGGKGSLADEPGFLHARDLHPLAAPQSALIYISDPFIRGLVGPAYRAEMTRRMRARAMLEIAEVAARAAEAETGRRLEIDGLLREDYLGARALRQGDGSEVLLTAAGPCDSLRGYRGTFLPIPDVGVELLTAAEAEAYQKFSNFYRRQWERVDPVAIRLLLAGPGAGGTVGGSAEAGGGPERIELTIDILPFAREPYQVLRAALGEPSRRTMAPPPPREIVSLEGELSPMLARSAVWIRAGILDFERPLALDAAGGIRLFGDLGQLPAYAILPVTRRLPDGSLEAIFLSGKPGPDGMLAIESGILGVPAWGKAAGDHLVISPRKEVLDTFGREIPEILLTESERPAQARLRMDLTGARAVLPALRTAAYQRALEASTSGAALLSSIHGILKVPLADCEKEAERILGARIACPAGGRFVPTPYPMGGGLFFASGAFTAEQKGDVERARAAAGFRHTLLDQLQALSISFTLSGRSLHSEAVILWRGNRAAGGTSPGPGQSGGR